MNAARHEPLACQIASTDFLHNGSTIKIQWYLRELPKEISVKRKAIMKQIILSLTSQSSQARALELESERPIRVLSEIKLMRSDDLKKTDSTWKR